MPANLSWVEPSNVVDSLREGRSQLCRLSNTRGDMPPAVNVWIESLDGIIQGLMEYTDSCRRAAPRSAPTAITESPADHPYRV
jgi:hypothetical protein